MKKAARPTPPEEVSGKARSSARMQEILASAARIFYEKGYHATTIEDVARDVGMLKGSLYYYIDSKEDLLYQILMDVITQGDRRVAQSIESVKNPVRKLEKGLEAHIEHIIENQVRVGLFLHEFDNFDGRRWRRVRDVMRRYQQRFEEIIRAGQASGNFVAGDPWLVANAVLGAGNWIYRWYPGGKQPGVDAVKKVFVPLILQGIRRQS